MSAVAERKKAVLCAIIESYIRTGEPVGSKVLAVLLGNAVSSATIRNDMAQLTALGYLEQPHTSAGRIPTAKAFRLYIDELMPHNGLTLDRQNHITRRLEHASGDPERLLSEATQMLSEATGCAAMTTAPRETANTVRRIEFLRMSARTVMVALMTSSGNVRSRLCRVEASVSDERLQVLCTLLSDVFVGCPLTDISQPQLQQMLIALGSEGILMAGVLTGFYDLVTEAADADVVLAGQLKLLENPDYQWDNARMLLGFLSRREQLAAMLAAYTSGLHVLLGSESLFPELYGSSMIVTQYSPDGQQYGTIGLIGPVRMDYAQAIPQLEFIAGTMERLMAELW